MCVVTLPPKPLILPPKHSLRGNERCSPMKTCDKAWCDFQRNLTQTTKPNFLNEMWMGCWAMAQRIRRAPILWDKQRCEWRVLGCFNSALFLLVLSPVCFGNYIYTERAWCAKPWWYMSLSVLLVLGWFVQPAWKKNWRISICHIHVCAFVWDRALQMSNSYLCIRLENTFRNMKCKPCGGRFV